MQYVVVLPSRADAGLKELMGSRGRCIMKVDGRARRKIELWRLKKQGARKKNIS